MAKINLLPWREELRKERQKNFAITAAIAALIAGGIFFYVHTYVQALIDGQNARNTYLRTEIKQLDKKIAEIKRLEATKARLIQKMNIIQRLQQSRPEIVHLFDELVRTLPSGVYLTSVQQRGNRITVRGVAESNARVSAYMRKIDESQWLGAAKLITINATSVAGQQKAFNFALSATQTRPKPPKTGGEKAK